LYQLDKYPKHIQLIDWNRINVNRYPRHIQLIEIGVISV